MRQKDQEPGTSDVTGAMPETTFFQILCYVRKISTCLLISSFPSICHHTHFLRKRNWPREPWAETQHYPDSCWRCQDRSTGGGGLSDLKTTERQPQFFFGKKKKKRERECGECGLRMCQELLLENKNWSQIQKIKPTGRDMQEESETEPRTCPVVLKVPADRR